jgi:hypothetical protein
MAFMDDLRCRLATRVQLTTDGHKAYPEAVEETVGADIEYAMLVKQYGEPSGSKTTNARTLLPSALAQEGRWAHGSALGR